MADTPRAAELQVTVSRTVNAFTAEHTIPPSSWLQLTCSDPEFTPTPTWFMRERDGHGESRPTLGSEEQVFASLTFLPHQPVQDELHHLASALPVQHPLVVGITATVQAAQPDYNDFLFREAFPSDR